MIVIGLTGSIGMGKSLTTKMFYSHNIHVFDADKEVHKILLEKGSIYIKIAKIFPESIDNEIINRKKLGNIVFYDPVKMDILEHIMHPYLEKKILSFLRKSRQLKRKIIVLDIPLLFETHFDRLCNYTVTVTTSKIIQRQRVLRRCGMSPELFNAITSMQISSHSKELASDFVIKTGLSKREIYNQINNIIRQIS